MNQLNFKYAKIRSYAVKNYHNIDLTFVYDMNHIYVVQRTVIEGLPPRLNAKNQNLLYSQFKHAHLIGFVFNPKQAVDNKELRAIFNGRGSRCKLVQADSMARYLVKLDNPVADRMADTIKQAMREIISVQNNDCLPSDMKVNAKAIKHNRNKVRNELLSRTLSVRTEENIELRAQLKEANHEVIKYLNQLQESDDKNESLNNQIEFIKKDLGVLNIDNFLELDQKYRELSDKFETLKNAYDKLSQRKQYDTNELEKLRFRYKQIRNGSFWQKLSFAVKGAK